MATDTTPGTGSAQGIIADSLKNYGMQGLADWAWAKYLDGESMDQIVMEMRKTPEYQAKYPAMEELAKQGKAISETTYNEYVDYVTQASRNYGVPVEMYATPQGIAKMLINGVSKAEADERFQMASVGAISAPDEVKRAYSEMYGLKGGDLIATYLDPEKALPILQRQAAAAQIGGAAYRENMVASIPEAERLAAQGVTYDQAVAGYGKANANSALDYAAGVSTSRDERVAAEFGDAAAQANVQRAIASRTAAFQAGGGFIGASGYTQSATGITGLSADTV